MTRSRSKFARGLMSALVQCIHGSIMSGSADLRSAAMVALIKAAVRRRTLGANSDRRDIGNPITPECPLLEQDRQDARGLGSSVVSRNLEQSPSSLRQTGIA